MLADHRNDSRITAHRCRRVGYENVLILGCRGSKLYVGESHCLEFVLGNLRILPREVRDGEWASRRTG